MNTIILVIIISFAFGQVPQPMAGIEGVWSIVNGDSTFMFNGDTGENPNYAKRMWRNFYHKTPITMGMVFDYAEECYNDSTVSYYRILSGGLPNDSWRVYCEKDSIDYWGVKCPENWFHPTPTFEGFIEWLKK